MKYQDGKIKKEHHIIPGFGKILQEIQAIDAVSRIIPGRIARSQGPSSKQHFSISYPTSTGYKCIMKKGGTAQEIFITCAAKFRSDVHTALDSLTY